MKTVKHQHVVCPSLKGPLVRSEQNLLTNNTKFMGNSEDILQTRLLLASFFCDYFCPNFFRYLWFPLLILRNAVIILGPPTESRLIYLKVSWLEILVISANFFLPWNVMHYDHRNNSNWPRSWGLKLCLPHYNRNLYP